MAVCETFVITRSRIPWYAVVCWGIQTGTGNNRAEESATAVAHCLLCTTNPVQYDTVYAGCRVYGESRLQLYSSQSLHVR